MSDKPEADTAAPEYRKKIVMALCEPYLVPEEGETKWLMEIMGEVREASPENSQFGEYFRLKGNFVARDLVHGRRYMATSCILPSLAEDIVMSHLDSVGFPKAASQVFFGMEVGMAGTKKKNPTDRGYTWTFRPKQAVAANAVQLIANDTWGATPQVAHDPETGEITESAPEAAAQDLPEASAKVKDKSTKAA